MAIWDSKNKEVDCQISTEIVNGEVLNVHKVVTDRGEKTYVYSQDYNDLISIFPKMDDDQERKEMIQLVVEMGNRFKLRFH